MGIFGPSDRQIERAVTAEMEKRNAPQSAQNFFELMGWQDMMGGSASGASVTTETALGVPAVWAAVNFISGTIAGLPMNVFERSGDDRKKISGPLQGILHDAVNDGMSSFEWRKYIFDSVFTGGRGLTFIERNKAGRVMNLWPLDPTNTIVKRVGGRKMYEYMDGDKTVTYQASEIIDIPFMLKSDGVSARSPITSNKDVIGLAISATQYGGRFFANGGVPPFAITGNFTSPGAMERASNDLHDAVRKAAKEDRQALTLPSGLEVKPIGVDPSKSQMVEAQRFLIEQIARIYSIPPTFLQDLTNGTFSNTEQQDLHFVKHTIRRWVEQFEQEVNLKLFGRANNKRFMELNVDGLLRGDFKTRMDGYGTGVQNGILKPNEARRKENLPDDENGNQLMIQGATVPIGTQPKQGDENE